MPDEKNPRLLGALYQLQYYLYCRAGQLSREKRGEYIDEVIALGEKILRECTEDVLRHGAIRRLCF